MIDIREPRKIRQYGEGDAFEPTPPPRAYEPPPEVKARYKKFKILSITAFALLFMLLTEGVLFLTFRVLMQQSLLTQILPLFIEVVVLGSLYAIYRCEQNASDLLTFSNLKIIIVGESLLLLGLLFVYCFKISCLICFIGVVSIAFALYILKFLKFKLRFRFLICGLIALNFYVTDVVALHGLEFTPRYIYISTAGYQDKINDENNYYYDNNAEVSTIDNNELNQIIHQAKTLSSLGWSAQRVNEIGRGNSLEFLNTMFSNDIRYGDLVNPEGRYDDAFFEEKSIFFSLVELENPNDTVELTAVDYATLFSEPSVTYTRHNSSKATSATTTDENARAICIIILEVSKAEENKVLDKMSGFSIYKTDINYR